MSLYNDLTTKYVQNQTGSKYCVCILIKTIKHTVASMKLITYQAQLLGLIFISVNG